MNSRGVVLLEVLVAIAILGAAGLSLVSLVQEGLIGAGRAAARERELVAEERVLGAFTLLNREDLDVRLGHHPVGEFVVDVERPERTLYRVALSRATAPDVEDLVTVVYRAEPVDAR
ncbi:MAG TPA: hypothetical protein VFD85_15440 [Gemmatimonadales bacterium]|nr:hypothetical protein [Gemmatimonadales bacterium]